MSLSVLSLEHPAFIHPRIPYDYAQFSTVMRYKEGVMKKGRDCGVEGRAKPPVKVVFGERFEGPPWELLYLGRALRQRGRRASRAGASWPPSPPGASAGLGGGECAMGREQKAKLARSSASQWCGSREPVVAGTRTAPRTCAF